MRNAVSSSRPKGLKIPIQPPSLAREYDNATFCQYLLWDVVASPEFTISKSKSLAGHWSC